MPSLLPQPTSELAHADELPQIRYALGLAQRHGLKLVIVGGADAWRIADVLRERRVAVIIAGVHQLPMRRDEDIDIRFRLPALLAQAGDVFCIARDGRTFAAPNERNQAHEAATAVAFGHPATRRCARSRCTPLRSWAWPTAWVRWRPVGSPVSSLPTAIRWTQRHV